MAIQINPAKCISCGACVVFCPEGAIHLSGGTASIDHSRCICCGKCICKCYMRAIYQINEK